MMRARPAPKAVRAVDSKLSLSRAIVVEGRDDVDAVSRAADALIIPTHGYGITAETWAVIAKAYEEKGLVILTDPDHAGEQIRRKLTEKFPDAVQAYVSREDATLADDIGVENASPEVIREALEKALARVAQSGSGDRSLGQPGSFGPGTCPLSHLSHIGVTMADLTELGLAGCEGASELRAAVCKALGIGYGNAGAMVKKLRGFGITRDELKKEVGRIKEEGQA